MQLLIFICERESYNEMISFHVKADYKETWIRTQNLCTHRLDNMIISDSMMTYLGRLWKKHNQVVIMLFS